MWLGPYLQQQQEGLLKDKQRWLLLYIADPAAIHADGYIGMYQQGNTAATDKRE
jgi:hypothetical protein